jgi:hypothetical protein
MLEGLTGVDDDFCQQYLVSKVFRGSPLILKFMAQVVDDHVELPLHIQIKLHDHSHGSKFITSC